MYVKGSLILDYVSIIRANRDRKWGRYLEPKDWDIINGKIFPCIRYPVDSFRRIGFAIFREIFKSDLQTARSFGRSNMKTLLRIYPDSFLVPGDPLESVKRFVMSRRTMIGDGSDAGVIEHRDGRARIKIVMAPDEDDRERAGAFCYQYAGNLEELVRQAGGEDIAAIVRRRRRAFEIMVKWEQKDKTPMPPR